MRCGTASLPSGISLLFLHQRMPLRKREFLSQVEPQSLSLTVGVSTSHMWVSHRVVPTCTWRSSFYSLSFSLHGTGYRTYYTMLPTDRLTTRLSPDAAIQFAEGGGGGYMGEVPSTTFSSGVAEDTTRRTPSGSFSAPSTAVSHAGGQPCFLKDSGYSFVLQDKDRGAYDRGVSLEAKAFAAEAEEGYRRTWEALHAPPGGPVGEELPDEVDEETGEVHRVGRTLFTAPFGETVIPAAKRGFSYRNQDGDWEYQHEQALQARGEGPPLDEHALLNLRKERQLDALVSGSPDLPLLEKAALVAEILATDFYPNRLVLQRENAEAVMVIWTQATAELRAKKKKEEKKQKKKQRRLQTLSQSPRVAASTLSGPDSGTGTSLMKGEKSAPSLASTVMDHRQPVRLLPDAPPSSRRHARRDGIPPPPLPQQAKTRSPASFPTAMASSREAHDTYSVEQVVASKVEVSDFPYLSEMQQLYTYEKQHAVAPTPHMMELLMISLATVPASAEEDEERDRTAMPRRFFEQKFPSSFAFHLAQRVLLDCDRYIVLPTPTLITAYIKICSIHNAMHYAVAQLRHLMKGLNIPMDADIATSLVKGLTLSGQVEEALAVLSRMQKIPVSIGLVHAAMETFLLSEDPLACFSLYHSCIRGGQLQDPRRRGARRHAAYLQPTAETFTLLLLACEQSGQWGGGRMNMISQEMKRFRVKGSTACLNLLLKGLLKEERLQTAAALMIRMKEKNVLVWPDLARGFTQLLES